MVKSIKTMSASDSERRSMGNGKAEDAASQTVQAGHSIVLQSKYSAKREQRQARKNERSGTKAYAYGVDSTEFGAIEERVSSAVLFNKTDRPLAPSRKLSIVKSFTQATVVCPISGIVSLMDIPFIPGKTLTYEHPLADIANARGIVQQGRLYLRQLDAQILAGLFLVLAQAYELYRDSYDASGAERNALLRSVPTDTLIEALLLIENWIHSANSIYIPKLSLVFDKEDTRNMLNARIRGWLDAVLEAIKKPDAASYDENAKPVRVTFASVASVKKAKRKMLSEALFAQKIWNQDKKAAKDHIAALSASNKFKAFLTVVFTGQGIQTVDTGLLSLAAEKLESMDQKSAAELAKLLRKDRAGFAEKDVFDEDKEEHEEKFSDKPIGFYAMQAEAEQDSEVAERSEAQCKEKPEQQDSSPNDQEQNADIDSVTDTGLSFNANNEIVSSTKRIPEPDYRGMTPIQKILARKAWLKATGQTAESIAVYDPAKQLVLPHKYVPAAESKIKEQQLADFLASDMSAHVRTRFEYIKRMNSDCVELGFPQLVKDLPDAPF